jgi:hypothetical protein
MRFTTGAVVGFAAGYYLGARAGRERYVEIERWLHRLQGSDTYQDVRGKVSDLAVVGAALARERIGGLTGGSDPDPSGDPDHEPTA